MEVFKMLNTMYKVKQYFVNVESDYYMEMKVTKWHSLTFTTLCANSADQKLMIFLLCFLENRFDISCKLHEMSDPFSWKNKKNILKFLLKFLPRVLSVNGGSTEFHS